MTETAYGDESVRRFGAPEACYLIGCYIPKDDSRLLIDELSHFDHSGKLHWRDAKASDKQRICQVIAKHPGTHVIIEALPLSPHVRDERARQHALSSTLLSLTHDYGVTRLVLERRDAAQDDKDRANAAVAS